jgi:hypothetical protein
MKAIAILHTLIDTKDLLASEFPLRQAKNFAREHSYLQDVHRMERYSPMYYITEVNPEHNYGLDFKIWCCYTVDGVKFLSEKSFGGCGVISNSALQRVQIIDGKIEFLQEFFKKDLKFRPALRRLSESGYIFAG